MGRIPDLNDINYILSKSSADTPLIIEMEDYAIKNGVPILDKLSSKFLEQVILLNKPARVLEIGTAIGYTSIKLANYMPCSGIIDTVELDKNMYDKACDFISRAKINSKINVIFDDAIDYLSATIFNYDLIYLDCDKEVYPKLFEPIMQHLNVGGVFLADNLLWDGNTASDNVPDDRKESTEAIRKFNDLFMGNDKLKSEILPVGDGIGLGIKLA